ncbi:aspartate ammonia-lyase [Dendrosporobacter sp. 1207_IL3150]|uniref:aspartate ammonia-lyase n=1 Tax=Dendrosporobacter sp. 1207_IL3150 TaxID=3084054 RepID=UPI002FDA8979
MRTERDFLGEVQLPDNVYYGVQTLRAVTNFSITGHRLSREFIVALAVIKKASANANIKACLLSENIGKAIIQAADEIISGKWHDQFVVDPIQGGAGTSMNMNANEVIANRAIEILGGQKGEYTLVSPNNHVNMSQSTNDVIPTAIRIATIVKGKKLVNELSALVDSFNDKAVSFQNVLKMGRTHLQDAVPITLGQEFKAYADALCRSIKRIEVSMNSLKEINMGATAVGTGLNAEPVYIAEVAKQISQLTDVNYTTSLNLIDATQNTDVLADFSSTLKVCALTLSKISNDLRLMASGPRTGLNEIYLPALQPGSSIMPGKINPVIPELVNQVAFQVIGNDQAVALAVEAGQLELNVMEPVLAYNLFSSLTILTNAVNALNYKCIQGIKANEEKCREAVNRSLGILTALTPHIGYERASLIAKEAQQTGKPIREIILEQNLMNNDQLDVILSPGEMTKPGISGKQYMDLYCKV